MKQFYKYFFTYHKVLSKKLMFKKLFIDICYILSSILSIILPIFLGKIVDSFLNLNLSHSFLVFIFLYVLYFIFSEISSFFRITFYLVDGPKYLFEKAIFTVLKKSDLALNPKKEMDRIFSFEHVFEFFYGSFAIFVFILPFLVFFSSLMIFINSWKVGLLMIFNFFLLLLSSNKKVDAESKISEKMNESEYNVTNTLSDLYSGYEEIRNYNSLFFSLRWLKDGYNSLVKAYDLFGKAELKFGLSYELLSAVLIPITIILISFEVFKGNLTLGVAIMILRYVENVKSYSEVYINDSDYIAWAASRAKDAYDNYLREV
ncbi:ABC-type bacteriocin/lantibiotic exporter with double-glycine peptidase domain [Thermosipho japonicus]|uniref:ABC-type bacteriocin/lantibiotic exporter with double-glycine peptidase domain n=1 Tax=Thermosipho japonicus TaxID=90323 RepID=A0A841GTA2_9BACT|nr:ABC transporter ATP-binding protein [Thermosipho japonicus]MBB6061581.1 ABC-type bacteriocin/lantibiotic exporter with double-glycine peptidase domain [Thermosipho japonicus]